MTDSSCSLLQEPLRVLELGDGVSSAYAARLLADHGADVVKVEPPEGDATRQRGPFSNGVPNPELSGLFLPLNLNKRSVVIESVHGDDAEVQKLLRWADVLVYSYRASVSRGLKLDADTLAERYPKLVTLCITPFGSSGPYSEYAAVELTVANAGGWAGVCPATHTDPNMPPLKVFGHQCALMSGIAGALAALAVTQSSRVNTAGEFVGEFIDLAEQDYVASVLEAGVPVYSYRGDIVRRHGERTLIPWRTFQAKDAPIFIVCIEQDQWERLVELMGNPEWAQLDIFADQAGRAENQDMVHSMVQEFVGEWEAEALYHAAQERRICAAPVLDIQQMSQSAHLRAREFFSAVSQPGVGDIEYPGSAIVGAQGRARIRKAAPRLGEHTREVLGQKPSTRNQDNEIESSGSLPLNVKPLAGVRVVDLTWVWAGTFCSMQLAHLGADVIRLESSTRPDLYRRLPVFPTDMNLTEGEEGLNRSGMFNQWNQGKRSVAVDLGKPEGIELVKAIVAEADVVVQNFGTGVLDRMGLGYSDLQQCNPNIILASISGYGQTGPLKHYMGYGPAMPPLTGLSAATGYIGGGPEEFGLSMPDPTAGVTAALAVVGALDRKRITGKGDHLDVSLWEATAALSIEAWMEHAFNGKSPERSGNRDPHMAPHGVFRCRGEASEEGDDCWVSIACATEADWQNLARCLGGDVEQDQRFATLELRKQNEDALEALVGEWCRTQDQWDITRTLQEQGIAAMPTMTTADIVNDPHLNERGFIERLEHPEVGRRAHTGIPWRLRNRPNGVQRPAPCLGADSDEVLEQTLGYSAEKIEALRSGQVLL